MSILYNLNKNKIFETVEIFRDQSYVVTCNITNITGGADSVSIDLELNENYISPLTKIKLTIPIVKHEKSLSIYEGDNNKDYYKIIDTNNISFSLQDKSLKNFFAKNKIQETINRFVIDNISEIKFYASNKNHY